MLQREMELAAAQSSQLNRAYRTLLSPLERAHYILSLHGVEESETEKLQDEDFITQIMEARQEVEEASDPAEISRIKEINQSSTFFLMTQFDTQLWSLKTESIAQSKRWRVISEKRTGRKRGRRQCDSNTGWASKVPLRSGNMVRHHWLVEQNRHRILASALPDLLSSSYLTKPSPRYFLEFRIRFASPSH